MGKVFLPKGGNMPDIRFNYSTLCELIPYSVKGNGSNPGSLVSACIIASLGTSRDEGFMQRFKQLPDTAAAQLEIYAALLDDVCNRLATEVTVTQPATESPSLQELQDRVRSAYAMLAITQPLESWRDLSPQQEDETTLFINYLAEICGKDASSIKPKKVKEILYQFLDKLKVRQFLQEQGVIDRWLATIDGQLPILHH